MPQEKQCFRSEAAAKATAEEKVRPKHSFSGRFCLDYHVARGSVRWILACGRKVAGSLLQQFSANIFGSLRGCLHSLISRASSTTEAGAKRPNSLLGFASDLFSKGLNFGAEDDQSSDAVDTKPTAAYKLPFS